MEHEFEEDAPPEAKNYKLQAVIAHTTKKDEINRGGKYRAYVRREVFKKKDEKVDDAQANNSSKNPAVSEEKGKVYKWFLFEDGSKKMVEEPEVFAQTTDAQVFIYKHEFKSGHA